MGENPRGPATSLVVDFENFTTKYNDMNRRISQSAVINQRVSDVSMHHTNSLNCLRDIVSESTISNPELASDAQHLVSKMSEAVVTSGQLQQMLRVLAEDKVDRDIENENLFLKYELLAVIDAKIRQMAGFHPADGGADQNRTTLLEMLDGWSSLYLDGKERPVNSNSDAGALKLAEDFSQKGRTWLERDCDLEWHMSMDANGDFTKLHTELLKYVPFKYTWSKNEKIRIFQRVLDLQDLMKERCSKAGREPELFFRPIVLSVTVKERLEELKQQVEQIFGNYESFLGATRMLKEMRHWHAHANAFQAFTKVQLRERLSGDGMATNLLDLAAMVAIDPVYPLAEMRTRFKPSDTDSRVLQPREERITQLLSDWNTRITVAAR